MDLNCPYCEKELDINHDDGFGYEENIKHQMTCDHCDKNFTFQTSISFYYESEIADCLNGEPHKYEKTCVYPKEFAKMKCVYCDDERELTDLEREEFGLGTKQDYYNSL